MVQSLNTRPGELSLEYHTNRAAPIQVLFFRHVVTGQLPNNQRPEKNTEAPARLIHHEDLLRKENEPQK